MAPSHPRPFYSSVAWRQANQFAFASTHTSPIAKHRNPFYLASALNTAFGVDATRALLRFARRTDAALKLECELGALS